MKKINAISKDGVYFKLLNPITKGDNSEYICNGYSKENDKICYLWDINNWFPGSFSHEEYR